MSTLPLGQLFICGFSPSAAEGPSAKPTDEILDLIKNHGCGSVILMRRNIVDIYQTRALVKALQLAAKEAGHERPLLIGIDQEGGLVSAFSSPTASSSKGTQMPGAMTASAAAASLPSIIGETAAATGAEMRLAGINWVFGPIADVNSEPSNPVIGVRSYSDDPNKAATNCTTSVLGTQSSKLAACLKHFPGHGDTSQDSHETTAVVKKTYEQMLECELVPFTKAVKAGVDTIMTAHISLPDLCLPGEDEADVIGDLMPVSINARLITGLLRKQMKFEGVIVSDCFEMEAVLGLPGGAEEGSVKAIKAGTDIVMICHTYKRQKGAIELVKKSLRDDDAGVLNSLKRVAKLKEKYAGTWADWQAEFGPDIDESKLTSLKKISADIALKGYSHSITYVPAASASPLSPALPISTTNIIILSPQISSMNRAIDEPMMEGEEVVVNDASNRAANNRNPFQIFEQAVMDKVTSDSTIKHVVYRQAGSVGFAFAWEQIETAVSAITSPTTLVFITRNAVTSSWQFGTFAKIKKLQSKTPFKIIVLASCLPYDAFSLKDEDCLCSYEYTPPAMEAAASVLFGQLEPVGQLPVSKNGKLPSQSIWMVDEWKPADGIDQISFIWEATLGQSNWSLPKSKLLSIILTPNAKVFLVHDPTTSALLGFSITYTCKAGAVPSLDYLKGSLAALCVSPSHQNQGIGLALHDASLSYLTETVKKSLQRSPSGAKKSVLQLGSIFPRIFPGLPSNLPDSVAAWFKKRDWNLAKKEIETESIDLYQKIDSSYKAPLSIMSLPTSNGITFRPPRKDELEALYNLQEKQFQTYTGWPEMFPKLVEAGFMKDIFCAFDKDGKILGATIAAGYDPESPIQISLAWPSTIGENCGIIACVGVDSSVRKGGVGLGMVCAALEYMASRGVDGVFVDWVSLKGWYEKAGFEKWSSYREAWKTLSIE